MRKTIYYLLIAVIFAAIGWFANTAYRLYRNPTSRVDLAGWIQRPLEKYSIENLAKTEFKPSEINIENEHLFSFAVDGKKVTGCINIPEGSGPFPVIVMFRGYVDQKTYKTCDGTERSGEFFAGNGFITIAPDFLGYGGSDKESENIFESRFQTYTTALNLLASVNSLEKWDKKNLFIWGHSNGGQVALTVLEITQKDYPTALWAPVSKPFPYSVLYYTDESDDRGKLIRRELAKFEEDYDVEKYSLVNYLDRIRAPIQLHQGTNDNAVPVSWSDTLSRSLLDLHFKVEYLRYPGADHNLNPSWNQAMANSLTFFRKRSTTSL